MFENALGWPEILFDFIFCWRAWSSSTSNNNYDCKLCLERFHLDTYNELLWDGVWISSQSKLISKSLETRPAADLLSQPCELGPSILQTYPRILATKVHIAKFLKANLDGTVEEYFRRSSGDLLDILIDIWKLNNWLLENIVFQGATKSWLVWRV